jgi:cell division protein YceG involved in septum cleavage
MNLSPTFFELNNSKRSLAWISVFAVVISSIWFIEDRFVNTSEMEAEIEEVIKDSTAQHDKIYLQMDIAERRALVKSEVEFKQMLKTDPDNTDLQEGLKEVQEEKREVKVRIIKRLQ